MFVNILHKIKTNRDTYLVFSFSGILKRTGWKNPSHIILIEIVWPYFFLYFSVHAR